MMKNGLLSLCMTYVLIICRVGVVKADLSVTFDFEGAVVGGAAPKYVESANQRVTDYMTIEYGSSVNATGAAVWRNSESAPLDLDWPSKTDDDQWLRTYGSASLTPGAFQISFDVIPILQAGADFYVFTTETSNYNFNVKAYSSLYGDRYSPNPSALVDEATWDFETAGSGIFDMSFSEPVSLLVFSDGGWYDIAIDNLQVSPVPTPAAYILGMLGLSVAGIKLRKYA